MYDSFEWLPYRIVFSCLFFNYKALHTKLSQQGALLLSILNEKIRYRTGEPDHRQLFFSLVHAHKKKKYVVDKCNRFFTLNYMYFCICSSCDTVVLQHLTKEEKCIIQRKGGPVHPLSRTRQNQNSSGRRTWRSWCVSCAIVHGWYFLSFCLL